MQHFPVLVINKNANLCLNLHHCSSGNSALAEQLVAEAVLSIAGSSKIVEYETLSIPFHVSYVVAALLYCCYFSGLMTSSLSSTSNGTASPKSTAEVSRRRTPSPRTKDVGR